MSDFLQDYLLWGDQVRRSLQAPIEAGGGVEVLEGLAVVGMGGSGIVGDVVRSLAAHHSRLGVPVEVVKDSSLPPWVGSGWAVLAVSYSGNTAETLKAVEEAVARGAFVAGVSSGGRLRDLLRSEGLPWAGVEGGHAPRSALPSLIITSLRLLQSAGIGLGGDLTRIPSLLRPRDEVEGLAGRILDAVSEGVPAFIATGRWYGLAVRAKNEFNENGKALAVAMVAPEWGHNDVVGFEGSEFPAIFFKDPLDPVSEAVEAVLKEFSRKHLIIGLRGVEAPEEYVAEFISVSQAVGIASVRYGLGRGVDPRETASIRLYKKVLKSALGEGL